MGSPNRSCGFRLPIRSYDMHHVEEAVPPAAPVLVVDLDGTLIKTDLLVETALALMKQSPFSLPLLPFWLARGKAHLKERIAERTEIDVVSLPYNAEFLDFLRAEHAAGRRIWLATASDRRLAEQVAAHLGIFDRVLATENGRNLSGQAKLDALVSDLGPQAFDYAGNALVDLLIWPQARRALVVHPEPGVETAAARRFTVERVFPRDKARWLACLKVIRPHQWVKNLLIFVPLLLAQRERTSPRRRQRDRFPGVRPDGLERVRAERPPGSHGRPPPSTKAEAAVRVGRSGPFGRLLARAVAAGGGRRPHDAAARAFGVVLVIYLAGTLAYSFKLKHHPMLDVMTLAGLYTLRIIAGVVAVAVVPTFWLLAFSVFIFLSLALVKRYSELRLMQREGKEEARGRGYQVGDLTILSASGIASGYLAALVLALYVNSPEILRLYRTPEAIWMLCPLLLYWVSRMWMITHRGDMHDDPIVFALTDGPSLLIGALAAAIVVGAAL